MSKCVFNASVCDIHLKKCDVRSNAQHKNQKIIIKSEKKNLYNKKTCTLYYDCKSVFF